MLALRTIWAYVVPRESAYIFRQRRTRAYKSGHTSANLTKRVEQQPSPSPSVFLSCSRHYGDQDDFSLHARGWPLCGRLGVLARYR